MKGRWILEEFSFQHQEPICRLTVTLGLFGSDFSLFTKMLKLGILSKEEIGFGLDEKDATATKVLDKFPEFNEIWEFQGVAQRRITGLLERAAEFMEFSALLEAKNAS